MARVEHWRGLVHERLWEDLPPNASRFARGAQSFVRVATIVAAGFIDDLCLTRASALAFATLIALVPVLALLFAVLRGLGWHGARLETLVLSKATLLSPQAIDTIVSYVDNVNFAGLGVLGAGFLLVTFASVVSSVEGAFNAIWDDVPGRTLGRRISHYFAVLVIAPILLVLTLSSSAAVRGHPLYLWLASSWGLGAALEYTFAYVGWVVSWILFAFLYMFVPNTRVRFVPAVVGGILAGSIWQLTQWLYLSFQIGVSNYDAIYGALAQLPLLMAWVYISWIIVLFGAEVAHALQTLDVVSRERRVAKKSGQAFREWIGLSIAVELARAAMRKSDPLSADGLARLLDVPLRTVRETLAALARDGLAHETSANAGCCYLSVAPQCVPLTRVITALRGAIPSESAHPATGESARRAREALERIDVETEDAFGHYTLRDVVVAWPALGERLAERHAGGAGAAARGSSASDTERIDRPKGEA